MNRRLAIAMLLASASPALAWRNGYAPPPPSATFNPSDKSSNIVLGGGNLNVTANTAADGAVRSTRSVATGKVYFEFTWNTNNGPDTGCGIATATASLTGLGPSAAGGVNIYSGGTIYFNGSATGLGLGFSPAAGDVVSVAVDVTAGLFWARLNGGNWLNSGTANPATGVGGLNISALFPTNAVFAMVSMQSTSANITANFGASAFAQAMPGGGFVSFNAGS